MKKIKKRYLVLLLLLGCVSVVYAMLLSNLSINGIGRIGKNTWEVSFKDIKVSPGSVEGTTELVGKTGINFSANLDKPGDYYEFSVDVVNNGTIDAMVDQFLLSDISDVSDLVKYEVTYNDGIEINKKDKLASLGKDTIKVRIEYRDDLSNEVLNSEDIEMNFNFEIDYIQDDGSSNVRLNSLKSSLIQNVKNVNGLQFNKATSSGEEGVYEYGDIHFFRGGEISNNVVIDNSCYYVIRTTEDGDIRLLYNGEYTEEGCNGENVFVGNSVFNSDVSNINYEGSEIRNVLLNWYDEHLSKYGNSLVGGYCSDLTKIDSNYYNKIKFENGIVDLNCDTVIEDKVGLLNVDEILMSGFGRNGTYKSYLDADAAYYSMSIYSYNSNEAKAIIINEYGTKNLSLINKELGVRPVITIKGNTGFISGTGSKVDPYIISLKV